MVCRKRIHCLAIATLFVMLVPTIAITENIHNEVELILPENTIAYVSINGNNSDGLTFIVHDVYYDGYLLMLSITQRANSPSVHVYEDEVLGYTHEELLCALDIPSDTNISILGSYCNIELLGDENSIVSSEQCSGTTTTNGTLIEHFRFHFLPTESHKPLKVNVHYGVVETPGRPDLAQHDTFIIEIPVQSKSEISTISIPPSIIEDTGIQNIYVTQSQNVAGVYIFFAVDDIQKIRSPIEYLDSNMVKVSSTGYVGYDAHNNLGYAYQAFLKEDASIIRVINRHNLHLYEINIADCTINSI